MAVSQVFIFHFKSYSIISFRRMPASSLLSWAFLSNFKKGLLFSKKNRGQEEQILMAIMHNEPSVQSERVTDNFFTFRSVFFVLIFVFSLRSVCRCSLLSRSLTFQDEM